MSRAYDSPVRRQQAAETRERIVEAGSEVVHGFSSWNWRELTVRAVAERAGVSERTVYRHFASERELRDAILARLEDEADIDLESLELEDLAAATRRLFRYLRSFPIEPRELHDPTFVAVDERRRDAIRAGVERLSADWTVQEREQAAAMLDLLWCLPTYERLVTAWDLDADQAGEAVGWVIGLMEDAIRTGNRPGG